jgi:predicted RNase H-like nuclease (RuvC/YqgF family)
VSRTNNRKLRERVRRLEHENAILKAANRDLGVVSARLAAELARLATAAADTLLARGERYL